MFQLVYTLVKETKSNNNEEIVIRQEDWTEAKPRTPFIGYMKKHS